MGTRQVWWWGRKREPVKSSTESDGLSFIAARTLLTVDEICSVPVEGRRTLRDFTTKDFSRIERLDDAFRYIIPDRDVSGVIEAAPDVEANGWRLKLWLLPDKVKSADADDAALALAVLVVSEPPCATTMMREPAEVMTKIVFASMEISLRQDIRCVLREMEKWAARIRESGVTN